MRINWDPIEQAAATAKFDRCVAGVMKRQIKKFKNRNGRAPNDKQKKKLRSSSFAICTSQLGKKESKGEMCPIDEELELMELEKIEAEFGLTPTHTDSAKHGDKQACPVGMKRNKDGKCVKVKSKSDESKANRLMLLEELFNPTDEPSIDDIMIGDGITEDSLGHVHSFHIQATRLEGNEWIVEGWTVSSNDDETPHKHTIFERMKIVETENGDITFKTSDATKGPRHTHIIKMTR